VAALRLPKVVSRRAKRRLEEIEIYRLLTVAHQRGAPATTIRDTLGQTLLSTTDLSLSSSPTDGSSLYLKF